MRLTHIGGPTVLIEAHGWRLLVDPTFDPPGQRYGFGWGASSSKTAGPAVPVDQMGPLDGILVSHDRHADNLDIIGRSLLPAAGAVVTTRSGQRRLRSQNTRGLAPWASTVLETRDRPALEITATPCRHGPPLSRPIVGEVIGFALRWPDADNKTLWISGDTALYRGVREVATRIDVDVAVIHLGGVRFPTTGRLRYSMTGRDAVELLRVMDPRVAVPVHYEGWTHFQEPRGELEKAFANAPAPVRERIVWLTHGVARTIDDPA